MIFLVEFLEDDKVPSHEPTRVAVELADEVEVIRWLAGRRAPAYVRQLFDPYGFLWVPPAGPGHEEP